VGVGVGAGVGFGGGWGSAGEGFYSHIMGWTLAGSLADPRSGRRAAPGPGASASPAAQQAFGAVGDGSGLSAPVSGEGAGPASGGAGAAEVPVLPSCSCASAVGGPEGWVRQSAKAC